MSAIRIEVVDGLYDNDDAYDRAIYYVSKTHYMGAYGVCPIAPETAVEQFAVSREESLYETERNLWHFFISFENIRDYTFIWTLANQIAAVFMEQYQVYYCCHTDSGHLHVHFIVNAYSYHPNVAPLDKTRIQCYMKEILSLLRNHYGISDVTLQFQHKRQQ